MKVAIVGAGISGLACAITLEKYGIVPDVFEQHAQPGGKDSFTGAMLQLLYRPVRDPLLDLVKHYGIRATPANLISKVVMISPGNVAAARGRLGYAFERGRSGVSVETQLYDQLQYTRVQFNRMVSASELVDDYERVIVATGSPFFAMERGSWSDIFRSWARGAVVEGRFEPTTWLAWFDKSYANNGFAYLGPFNAHKASLVLIISDIREAEAESRWRMFRDREKIGWRETESFFLEHNAGICFPRESGKIIFTGKAAGVLDYLLGFGIYQAVISGVLAAEAVYEGSSFERKIRPLLRRMYLSYLARLRLNSFRNEGYDRLLSLLKSPWVNRAVYNTNLDLLALMGNSLRLAGVKGKLAGKFSP